MQLRRTTLAFVVVLAPLSAIAFFTACGSSTDDTVAEAGTDGTIEAAKEAAVEAAVEASTDAGCQNDVDLTQYLPSADASIDVDAGGFPIAQCTGCFKDNCGTQINACNQDCACRQSVVDTITCVGQGTDFQTCGEDALLSGDNTLQALFACALGKCQNACIAGDGGLPTKDGGSPTDAGGGG